MNRLFALLCLAALLIGCDKKQAAAPRPSVPAEKVSLALNWFPEAEHGGYYAALVHGIYAEEGLDVTIIPGGPDVPVAPRVATGQVEFGVANADQVVFARAARANVVALMAPLQTSPRCIMVHDGTSYKSFADLNDMTLALGMQDAFAQFLKKNYPLRNVKIVPYPGSVATFLNDKSFGQQAYNISEPFLAAKGGAKPRVLMLSDAGWNPYTSVLLTADSLLGERRDMARRFVRASVRGWDKYMKEPTETNARINQLNGEMGVDILKFGVDEMQAMVYTPETRDKGTGAMTPERWTTLIRQMEGLELVQPFLVKPEECFTSALLVP